MAAVARRHRERARTGHSDLRGAQSRRRAGRAEALESSDAGRQPTAGEDAMADKHILHMVTPLKHMSPFDVNMALDAGFDAALPYTDVTLDEVTGLVQDAIFSRPPKIGVQDRHVHRRQERDRSRSTCWPTAKKALVPPFGISFFADPAGSFTTAAAMVACVEKTLKRQEEPRPEGRKVAVFGATGVVGFSAAVIAALEGADVTLVGYDGIKRVERRGRARSRRASASRCAPPTAATTRKKAEILADSRGRAVRRARRRARSCRARSSPRRRSSAGRRRRQRRAAGRRRRARRDGERRRAHSRTARSASVRWRSATSSTRPSSACSRSMIAADEAGAASISATPSRSRASSMRDGPAVLIAAASGRALAAVGAARRLSCRWSPISSAIRTRPRCAQAHVRLEHGLARGMSAAAAARGAAKRSPRTRQPIGVVCGTGFEDRPELLARIARALALVRQRSADRGGAVEGSRRVRSAVPRLRRSASGHAR